MNKKPYNPPSSAVQERNCEAVSIGELTARILKRVAERMNDISPK